MPTPQHLRVFLASPGDVADERVLVRRLLKDELPYDPFLRGRVTFDVMSWDDPAAPIALPARLRPQEAIIRFGTRPSECDIAVVVLWSRLGTHLDLTKFQKANGEPYLSGTEWEYEDACKGRPEIFLYRRTEELKVGIKDPELAEKVRQSQLVEQFCDCVSKNLDGSFRGNVTNYDTPTAFKERFETDLKHLLHERLSERDINPGTTATPVWTGSPYPGLRSFTTEEGVIFFGRGREVDALIARLRDPAQRFLAVVGASGTGKSSLIRAGLIPRLHDGAIEDSQYWRVVTCTPGALGDNPFLALAIGLVGMLPAHAQKPPIEIATVLEKTPQRISEYAVAPTGGAVLLFVDQLEELFTHAVASYREPFAVLLAHAVAQPHLRVVATLRADFLPQCAATPDLAQLLQAPAAIFPLAPPGPAALTDMIRKPAERAGLKLEDGLADEILKDAGSDPGALPLMAFCLEKLYWQTAPKHHLTADVYEALGRLSGAISRQADALLTELRENIDIDLDATLPQVFQGLVHVDATSTVTRRRAFQDELSKTTQIGMIINKLVKGRLLAAADADGRATVALAHEALLFEWPALREWLDHNRAQLRRIQTLSTALSDAEQGVRGSAAQALGQIEPTTAEVVPALITALSDADKDVRESAAEALGRIGLVAVPALITALGNDHKDVRWNAVAALGQIGPATAEVVPASITALSDADKDVRWNAVATLGRIGPATAEVVSALITALGDGDKDIRGSAAGALGRIGLVAVPALITALGNDHKDFRWSAVCALVRIGPVAVPELITAFHNDDARVRESASYALARIDPAAVPELITAFGNDDARDRWSAAFLERIQSYLWPRNST